MGSLIIKEVVNELLTKGLQNAKVLLLAGTRSVQHKWVFSHFTGPVSVTEPILLITSAGGTGVLLNVDHVAKQLESEGHSGVQVRGLVDSGWFLDNKQYKLTDCLDTISCAPTEAIKRGIRSDTRGVTGEIDFRRVQGEVRNNWETLCLCRYWGALVPESCRQAHVGEEWSCFFGYKIYTTLKRETPPTLYLLGCNQGHHQGGIPKKLVPRPRFGQTISFSGVLNFSFCALKFSPAF